MHAAIEVDRFRAYAVHHGLELGHVTFEIGDSETVLPRLRGLELDLVLIDGGHGFPTPIIDWFYAARLLRPGGLVVIDDIQLPSVSDYLVRFLHADPRWEPVAGDGTKWVAFRKGPDVQLPEEWKAQPFLGKPASASLRVRAARRLHRLTRRTR